MTPHMAALVTITPQMKELFILLGAIVVVLLLVIIFFGGKSPLMRFLNLFLEENEGGAPQQRGGHPDRRRPEEAQQKKTSQPIVEMATLIRKCDDRLRIIESTGQQKLVDEYYEQFVEIVAEGRGMDVKDVKKLADGRVYTASQALENGLIDGIKTSEEFDAYVREESGVDLFYEPKSDSGYLSWLFGSISSLQAPKTETEILLDLADRLGNGGPMFYAEPIGQ